MSTIIDQNVVEMSFDNSNFEKNIHTSMESIDSLKKSLNFSSTNESFDTLNKSIKGSELSNLGETVDKIGERFSSLGIIGVTALQNITNKAVDTGTRLLKSLTIDQVKSGFDEYELKMTSTQTILNSAIDKSGKPLSEMENGLAIVNKKLDELNTYSDKTIYSFSDMTSNIGKFTNAGVNLDMAVKAIQGISNEAAISGANANEASRAMYNFSQALSAGYVKLIDWKSIENANMATMGFKNQLLQTAAHMGTAKKQADGMYKIIAKNNKGKTMGDAISATKNFNDSLSYQWMTTDVLTATLEQYSTDVTELSKKEKKAYEDKLKSQGYTKKEIEQIEKLGTKAMKAAKDVKTFSQLIDTLKESVGSGWASTFQTIFGDLEEAKQLWTGVYEWAQNIINTSSKARNDLLDAWKDNGGRKKLLDSVSLIGDMIVKAGQKISSVLKTILPQIKGKDLAEATDKFYKGLKKVDEFLFKPYDGKKTIFGVIAKGLGAIVSMIKVPLNFLSAFTTFATKLFKAIMPGKDTVKEFANSMLALFESIIKFSGEFTPNWFTEKIFDPISKSLGTSKKVVEDLLPSLKNLKDLLTNFLKTATTMVDRLTSGVNKLSDKVKNFIIEFVKWVESIRKQANDLRTASDDTKKTIEVNADLISILKNVWGVIKTLAKIIIGIITRVFKSLNEIFGDKTLEETIESLTNIILDLFKVFTAGTIAKSISTVSKNVETFAGGIGSLGEAMKNIASAPEKFSGAMTSIMDTAKKVDDGQIKIIEKLAASVLALAVSLVILSSIDTKKLGATMGAFSGAIATFVGAFFAISAISSKFNKLSLVPVKSIGSFFDNVLEIWKNGSQANQVIKLMLGVCVSMLLLAIALKKLSDIPTKKVGPALLMFTVLLSELVGAVAVLSLIGDKFKESEMLKSAGCMLIITFALTSLIPLITLLGALPFKKAAQAVGGVTILLYAMVGVVAALSKIAETALIKDLLLTATAFAIIALCISSLTPIITVLGLLPFAKAAQAVGGLILLLYSITGVVAIISKIAKSGDAKNLVIASTVFIIITNSLVSLVPLVSLLGLLPLAKAAQAVGGVTILLYAMVGVVAALNKIASTTQYIKDLLLVATVFEIIALAISSLTPIISLLGLLPLAKAAQAVGGFILLLAALTGAVFALAKIGENTDIESLLLTTGTILILTTAINSLIPLLTLLAALPIDKAAQAVVGLALIATILVVAIEALSLIAKSGSAKDIVTLSGALFIFASSIAILAPALALLAAIPMPALAKALIAVGAAIAIFFIAATALAPLSATLLTVSGSIAIFAAAIGLLGLALIALGTGFTSVGTGIIALVASLPAAVALIIGILPAAIYAISEFIKSMFKLIKDNVPMAVDAFKALLKGVIDAAIAIIGQMGPLITAVLKLIDSLLTALEKYVAPWAKKLFTMLLKILDVIISKTSEFVKRLIKFAINLIDGFAKGIEENKEKIKSAILNLLVAIWDLMCSFFGVHSPSTKMAEFGKYLLLGLINGIKSKIKDVVAKIKELCTQMVDEIKSKITEFKIRGQMLIDALRLGIMMKIILVKILIKQFIEDLKQKFNDKMQDFKDIGKNIIDGIKKGITTAKDKLIEKLEKVAQLIPDTVKKLLGIKSPSRVMAKLGGYIMEGLAVGIDKESKYTMMSMKDAINDLISIASNDIDSSPVITPVLDLSNIENGAGAINSIFGGSSIPITSNLNAVSAQFNNRQNRTTNSDIVSAIDKLKQSIENNPTTVNNIDGITYSGSSDISDAIGILVNAAKVSERSS